MEKFHKTIQIGWFSTMAKDIVGTYLICTSAGTCFPPLRLLQSSEYFEKKHGRLAKKTTKTKQNNMSLIYWRFQHSFEFRKNYLVELHNFS